MTTPAAPSPRRAPKQPPPDAAGDAARRVAAGLLEAVIERGRTLEDAERGAARSLNGLEPRDRGFVHATVLATLRRLGEIDAEIDRRLQRPLPPEAGAARAALRLGAAELLFMDAPAYAAVDAAVRFTKRAAPRFSGLVNAVLRRIASEPRAPLTPADAARLNTPDWLWARLAADWGEDRAAAIAQAHLRPAPLDLTPRDAEAVAELARRLGGTVTPTGSIRLTQGGSVTALPGYDRGLWWVQDAAAALPARLMGAAPGLRVLDLCAAPGGKTLQLAAAGAGVTAVDASAPRLERVRDNLRRTGLEAELVAADALTWTGAAREPFDAVLLDAPCSASGTFRRHPEGARIRDAQTPDAYASRQDALLDAAWRAVRPGGRLVYAVCSLFRLEGEERATAFPARHANAAAEPIRPDEIGEPDFVTAAGWLRVTPAHWPEIGGLDGFFAARFLKTG